MYKEKNMVEKRRVNRSIPIGHMLKFRGDRPDTLNQKLNDELLYSYKKLVMSNDEVQCRRKVFELFKKNIESEFDCVVETHGSFRTNTMVYDSDIDITVLMGDKKNKQSSNETLNNIESSEEKVFTSILDEVQSSSEQENEMMRYESMEFMVSSNSKNNNGSSYANNESSYANNGSPYANNGSSYANNGSSYINNDNNRSSYTHGSEHIDPPAYNNAANANPAADPIKTKATINRILGRIVDLLYNAKLCTGPIIHLKHARIPVIKCVDKKFNLKIDIVIDQYNGIDSANFILEQIRIRPYIKQLVILLKYFLKRRQLSDTARGGLCAYGQFLLILNFVQMHPLLQGDDFDFSANIGTIFMDFFQFYGTEFPFQNAIISVLETKYRPNRTSQIYIEDPINPSHNVTAGCTALHTIREIFSFSYKIMAAAFAEKVDPKKAIGELWLRLDEREFTEREENKKKIKEFTEGKIKDEVSTFSNNTKNKDMKFNKKKSYEKYKSKKDGYNDELKRM